MLLQQRGPRFDDLLFVDVGVVAVVLVRGMMIVCVVAFEILEK